MIIKKVSDELADKTLSFWRISRAWNNVSKEEIPMHVALGTLSEHMYDTNPGRPLVRQMTSLQLELIHDAGRQPRDAASITPLPLRKTI